MYVHYVNVCISLFQYRCIPAAVMITTTYNNASGSLLVQWNEVTDYFTVNYTVTWYNESGIVGMVTVNSPPYTVTGLTVGVRPICQHNFGNNRMPKEPRIMLE